jgi:hypothetical protein
MKQIKPKFYAIYKDFNTGKIEQIDVLDGLFREILTSKNTISKKHFYIYDKKSYKQIPVTTKEQLCEFIKSYLMYHFWSKCEWEFIVIDWPNRDTIEQSRPQKIDVYEQVKPNIPVITDLVWDYVEPKINK